MATDWRSYRGNDTVMKDDWGRERRLKGYLLFNFFVTKKMPHLMCAMPRQTFGSLVCTSKYDNTWMVWDRYLFYECVSCVGEGRPLAINLCFPCPLAADLIKDLQCSNWRNLLLLWPPPTSSPLGNYIFALIVCGGRMKKEKTVQSAWELYTHCIVNRKYIADLSAISSSNKQKKHQCTR